MSDVVVQGLASNLFWLVVFIVTVAVFRREIRNLLNALGKFNIAGASFELKDSRATLESYVVLTNIFVEILTQRDSARKVTDLLSSTSVRQLAKFAITYAKDVPEDVKQVELLKNIAMIIGLRGNTHEALAFLDALLQSAPHDLDILNLKANALFETGADEHQVEAEAIRDRLVTLRPRDNVYRFNRALSKAILKKDDEALADLAVALELSYWKRRKDFLDVKEFRGLRGRPEFEELVERLRVAMKSAADA